MTVASPRLDGRGWTLLVALAILWSASFIFIKVAGEEIPVFTLVLVRVGIAALLLHAFVLASGRRYPNRSSVLVSFAIMGLLNNVLPFALIVYATASIGAGAASILNATSPIFALLVAHVATADEKVTPAKLAGILLGIGGVAAMESAVFGRRFRGIDATVSATCQLSASTLILLPLALIVDQPWFLPMPGASALGSAIALAIVSTALAYVLYYALIRSAGATNTILVTLLIPAGGVFLAWLLLGEAFTSSEAAGMVLIGSGLVVIDGRALARLRRAAVSVGSA